jgi:hypothetical protein
MERYVEESVEGLELESLQALGLCHDLGSQFRQVRKEHPAAPCDLYKQPK